MKSYAHVKIGYETNKLFVSIMNLKDETPEDGLAFIRDVAEKKGEPPKFIRLDGAKENRMINRMVKRAFPVIDFEFTAKETPEQNGKVERGTATN